MLLNLSQKPYEYAAANGDFAKWKKRRAGLNLEDGIVNKDTKYDNQRNR